MKGHWSIWVNANWRVIFRFTGPTWNWLTISTIIRSQKMMKHHPHPGELLREDVLKPLGLA